MEGERERKFGCYRDKKGNTLLVSTQLRKSNHQINQEHDIKQNFLSITHHFGWNLIALPLGSFSPNSLSSYDLVTKQLIYFPSFCLPTINHVKNTTLGIVWKVDGILDWPCQPLFFLLGYVVKIMNFPVLFLVFLVWIQHFQKRCLFDL